MGFLDTKDVVMDIILTQHGRKLLGQGKLSPKFYRFGDEEVDYQACVVPGWTPASLGADLVAWYDASILSSIEMNSSNEVSLWRDMSGYNNHLSGYASAKPIYVTGAIGSGPAMHALANNEYFWNTQMDFGGAMSTAYEFIFCGKAPAGGISAQNNLYHYTDGVKNVVLYEDDPTFLGYKQFTLDPPNHTLLYQVDISASTAQLSRFSADNGSTLESYYTNLTLNASASSFTALSSLGDFTLFNFNVSSPSNTNNAYASFVLILRRAITDGEHRQIYNYCVEKGWLSSL